MTNDKIQNPKYNRNSNVKTKVLSLGICHLDLF